MDFAIDLIAAIWALAGYGTFGALVLLALGSWFDFLRWGWE